MPDSSFQYSLNDEPQRAKRNLMLFSSLVVFLSITRELPGNIPLLGIQLDGSQNQNATVWSLIAVQLYFFSRFAILTSVDVRNWLYNQMFETSREIGTESELSTHDFSKEDAFVEHNRLAFKFAKLSSYSRWIELGLPLIYGVGGLVAACSLFSLVGDKG